MKKYITVEVDVPDGESPRDVEDGLLILRETLATRLKGIGADCKVVAGVHHQELRDVNEFHQKFLVPMSPVPAFLDLAAQDYRFKFMDEELTEFRDAYIEGNLDKAFDSLLDLVYVAIGTALKMGLPWAKGWERVHAANMTKRLALPDGSDSKRKNPLDVVKPEDFVAPSHWDLLNLAGADQTAITFHASSIIQLLAKARSMGATTFDMYGLAWGYLEHTSGPGQPAPLVIPASYYEATSALLHMAAVRAPDPMLKQDRPLPIEMLGDETQAPRGDC